MAWVRKRRIMVKFLCCCLVFSWPFNALAANQVLSVDVFSLGPLSLEFDLLSFRRKASIFGLLGGSFFGDVIRGFFSKPPIPSQSKPKRYFAKKRNPISHPTTKPATSSPHPPLSRIIIHPEKHYIGLALCIKFNDVIQNCRLELPGSAFIELRENGKMVFRNSPFRGHAFLHYNRCISIWDADGNIVCVVTGDRGNLLVIQENSSRAALAVQVLFGGPA